MTSAQIIDRFGGTSALARLLSLSVSTVDSWRAYNQIPKWRQEALLQLALNTGVELATGDFPGPDERVARKVAA